MFYVLTVAAMTCLFRNLELYSVAYITLPLQCTIPHMNCDDYQRSKAHLYE